MSTLPEMACVCRKGSYVGVYLSKFFKGFSTTRLKKICRALPRRFYFREKSSGIFLKFQSKDRRFRVYLLFLSKFFLRQNHPLGGFKSLLCQSRGQNHFKNSSTAPII